MWCGQKRFYLSTSWVEPQNGEKPPYTGKLRYQKAYNREKSSIEEKPIQEGKSDLDVTLLEKSYVVDKLSFAEKRRYTGAPNLVEKCLFLPKPYVVKKSNNEDQKFHEVLDRFEKKLLDERGEHIKVDEEKDKRVVTSLSQVRGILKRELVRYWNWELKSKGGVRRFLMMEVKNKKKKKMMILRRNH